MEDSILFSLSFNFKFSQVIPSIVYTECWGFTITPIVVAFLLTKCQERSDVRKDLASVSRGYAP